MAAADPPLPPVEPEAARAAAQDIVSRPEFQPRSPSLLSRFFGWLGDVLSGGGRETSTGGAELSGGDPAALRLVVWVLLAGLVLAAAVAVVRWARGSPLPFRRRRAKLEESDEISPLEEDRDGDSPWRSLAEFEPGEVEALEAAGQWRDALLARYRGAVARLVGAGVVDGHPGASSAQLRAEVDAGHRELSQHFARLTATFETVWYGGVNADETLAAQARQAALAVDAAVGATAGAAATASGKRTGTSGSTRSIGSTGGPQDETDGGNGIDIIIRSDAP